MEITNLNEYGEDLISLQHSIDYCIKGTLMADNGMLTAALESFDRAIESNPGNHIAYFNRATIKIDLGDLAGAKIDFDRFDSIAGT